MRKFLAPFVLAVALLSSFATAQERKYDFALVRKSGGMASWGSWEWSQAFRNREPGLYVKKDGQTYLITDADTIKKAEAALDDMRKLSEKMKKGRHARKDEEHAKAMAEQAKEQVEIERQMKEASDQFEKETKKGPNPEAEARFHDRMEELGEKMKVAAKAHKPWNSEAFQKEMEQFGKQMAAAGKSTGDKIVKLIDLAFEKNLARKV